MNPDPNPYESPQSPDAPTRPKRASKGLTEFFALVAVQLILTAMLAPADGGRWVRYTLIYLVTFDIAFYFAFLSGRRSGRGFSWEMGHVFVVASILIAFLGTSVTELFQLP